MVVLEGAVQRLGPVLSQVVFEVPVLGVLDDDVEGIVWRLRAHAQQVDDVLMVTDGFHDFHFVNLNSTSEVQV